jgi:putative molybdopterin biosynthesis protein
LAQENYHLVCLKSALEQPAIRALRQVLRHPDWQQQMATLAGYEAANGGEVLSLRERLPWWRFQKKKTLHPASSGR